MKGGSAVQNVFDCARARARGRRRMRAKRHKKGNPPSLSWIRHWYIVGCVLCWHVHDSCRVNDWLYMARDIFQGLLNNVSPHVNKVVLEVVGTCQLLKQLLQWCRCNLWITSTCQFASQYQNDIFADKTFASCFSHWYPYQKKILQTQQLSKSIPLYIQLLCLNTTHVKIRLVGKRSEPV